MHLGDDASIYVAALTRYANSVEIADEARRAWEAEGRPLIGVFPNQTEGVHVLVSTMQKLDTTAAKFGEALGLTPASAKRIGPSRGRGRPPGANSAPDRVVPKLRLAARPGPRLREDVAAAVDRRRGHAVED